MRLRDQAHGADRQAKAPCGYPGPKRRSGGGAWVGVWAVIWEHDPLLPRAATCGWLV